MKLSVAWYGLYLLKYGDIVWEFINILAGHYFNSSHEQVLTV